MKWRAVQLTALVHIGALVQEKQLDKARQAPDDSQVQRRHLSVMSERVGICLCLIQKKFDDLGCAILYCQVQKRLSKAVVAVFYKASRISFLEHFVHFDKLRMLAVLDELDEQEHSVFGIYPLL